MITTYNTRTEAAGLSNVVSGVSGEITPMVAVRSTGYSFDAIIGYQDEAGHKIPMVDEKYLATLVAIANDRFRINTERIERFRAALIAGFHVKDESKNDWEDSDARRQRKREEGLAQQALQAQETQSKDTATGDDDILDNLDMLM